MTDAFNALEAEVRESEKLRERAFHELQEARRVLAVQEATVDNLLAKFNELADKNDALKEVLALYRNIQ